MAGRADFEAFPELVLGQQARVLAVAGSNDLFRRAMVECYQNLCKQMPDNGMHAVMFTHQDATVWADLSLIMWASGLRVTSAWCIQTEREATGPRQGNYVQGTVLLVLRKQTSTEMRFLDEVFQEVEIEVRRQLDAMLALDDREDPNFGDPDYQLAAYAAACGSLPTGRSRKSIPPANLHGCEFRERSRRSSI